MRILAIESSCDESAVAVLDRRKGLLAHELFSQVDLHRVFGGVVPELASRDHVRRLLPLVKAALEKAGADSPSDSPHRAAVDTGSASSGGAAIASSARGLSDAAKALGIDGIAYTAGPGLIGA